MRRAGSYLVTVLGILLAGGGLYFIRNTASPEGIMTALPYLMVGIGCGLFGSGLGSIFNRLACEKDPRLAKKKEIEEKDERNIMIGNAARSKGFQMMTFVFGALMLAYALMGASLSVVIPLVAAYLFVEIYAIWYQVKLNNEM